MPKNPVLRPTPTSNPSGRASVQIVLFFPPQPHRIGPVQIFDHPIHLFHPPQLLRNFYRSGPPPPQTFYFLKASRSTISHDSGVTPADFSFLPQYHRTGVGFPPSLPRPVETTCYHPIFRNPGLPTVLSRRSRSALMNCPHHRHPLFFHLPQYQLSSPRLNF